MERFEFDQRLLDSAIRDGWDLRLAGQVGPKVIIGE